MDADAIRFHLMDGSVITGKLSLKNWLSKAAVRQLERTVASIRSFTPGLAVTRISRSKSRRLDTSSGFKQLQ